MNKSTVESRSGMLAVSAICLLLAVPAFTLVPGFEGRTAPRRSDERDERAARNSSALGAILGEFRTSLSDLMYIKTERYLDSGVAYAPHLSEQQLRQASAGSEASKVAPHHEHDHDHAPEAGHGTEHDHDHDAESTATASADSPEVTSTEELARRYDEGLVGEKERETAKLAPQQTLHESGEGEAPVPTIIQTSERDYRGLIGDLEREVKPWRDPKVGHVHTGGTELLPWYRLATLANPHDIQSYLVGTWWLKEQGGPNSLAEAERFIGEGINHNADAFQLHVMHGHILRLLHRDDDAYAEYRRATDLALAQRPQGGTVAKDWTQYKEDDAVAATSLLLFLTRDREGYPAALRVAEQLQAVLGDTMPNFTRITREMRVLSAQEDTTSATAHAMAPSTDESAAPSTK